MYVCHTYIPTYMHACMPAYMHTYIHTYINACMHVYTCVYTYTRMYLYMYIDISPCLSCFSQFSCCFTGCHYRRPRREQVGRPLLSGRAQRLKASLQNGLLKVPAGQSKPIEMLLLQNHKHIYVHVYVYIYVYIHILLYEDLQSTQDD